MKTFLALSLVLVMAFVSSSFASSSVGCFKDQEERILEGKFTSSSKMTIQMCLEICFNEGDYYAGLGAGDQCFCGKHLKDYKKLPDSKCSARCSGDRNQKCGGAWKISVFNTDVADFCYQGDQQPNEYTGHMDKTLSGYTCQKWSEQTPHKHTFTDRSKYPDASIAEASNYCRDPDNSGYVWCYTTDPNKRWQACNVTRCSTTYTYGQDMCYPYNTIASAYSGHWSITKSGKTCQEWSSQYPHSHDFLDGNLFPDGSVHDAKNYCRDPDGTGEPWCYTTDPDMRWERCDIVRCMDQSAYDKNMCYSFNTKPNAYSGHWNRTKTGRTCQKWTSQSPHSHDIMDGNLYPDGSVEDAKNYCRDPDGTGEPWCYTTDPGLRWEICDVARCVDQASSAENMCFTDGSKSNAYSGHWSVTKTGKTCQEWNSQSPHSHDFMDGNLFPDGSVHDAKNYCRDPDGTGEPWCYTTDPDLRWERCNIAICNDKQSNDKDACYPYNTKSNAYFGHWNISKSGRNCQDWKSQSPHSHDFMDGNLYPDGSVQDAKNYCRDPDGTGEPWCYTTDPGLRWEVCDIVRC